jgi:predicted transcriptional regulator
MAEQLIESASSDLFLNNGLNEWQKQTSLETLLIKKRSFRRAIRSQDEIETAILDTCRTPTVQHWIMVKARLGYDTFWKHMNLLLNSGLMDETFDGSKTLYQTNAKGLDLLGRLQ